MKFFVSFALLLAACASDPKPAVDAPVAPTADASTQPSLEVIPTPSTVAAGGSVSFAVNVTNFRIVDPRPGPAPKAGEGHFHYYLDDAVDYVAGWTASVTIRTTAQTSLGEHTVRFVLATSAHEEVTPKVETTATFTVQ